MMSNSDCATVIKRGYLFDKKAGFLDGNKRKWFVLRHDSLMGYCILEYFKDEKSWCRREPSKGFINVQEIVEVIRVQDKKQTLELLCPGVGYRLMAYSDADADDWVEAIRKLIIYRKDRRSMTFPRITGQGNSMGTSPLSSSPPSHPITTNSINGPVLSPHHTTLNAPPSFSIDGTFPHQSPLHQQSHHHQSQLQFPTPPETIIDTTNPLTTTMQHMHHHQPMLQKQGSHERTNNPYPSPPSSNDSASMCGSSTNSFDSGSFNDGISDVDASHRVPVRFRVNVNDTDKLNVVADCDLIVTEDSMTLLSLTSGNQIASWPLGAVRRYGINNVCFTFESGRYGSTGEGNFYLYSPQSRLIYNKVHSAVLRLNRSPSGDSLALRTGSSMIIPISRVPSSTDSLSSPPQYNHIEHHLRQPISHELYTQLQNSPTAISACSSFATFSTEYERLSHTSPINNSSAPILPMRQGSLSSQGSSSSYPEPLYSTLTTGEIEEEGTEDDNNMSDTTPCACDEPPPIPPRVSRNTSV